MSLVRRYGNRMGYMLAAMAARDAYRYGKRKVSTFFRPTAKRMRMTRRYTYKRRGYKTRIMRSWKTSGPSGKMVTRRRAARLVGHAPKTRESKRSETFSVSGQELDSRTLYSWDLTELTRRDNTGVYERNDQRERDRVIVSGFKITGCINALPDLRKVHAVNIAIISYNSKRNNSLWGVTTTQFVSNSGFFSDPGALNQEIDFGTQITSSEYRNLPINKDLYTVVMRKRIYLHPQDRVFNGVEQVYYDRNGKSSIPFNLWVPLNRQVRYFRPTTDDDRAQDGRCALVIWHDSLGTTDATEAAESEIVNVQMRNITYFRELS